MSSKYLKSLTWRIRVASQAPSITPAPNSGQNKSSQCEPGKALRAITGKNVAVMM